MGDIQICLISVRRTLLCTCHRPVFGLFSAKITGKKHFFSKKFCQFGKRYYLCTAIGNPIATTYFKTGALVQLVRMPACHAGGRWFESCTHRSGERIRARLAKAARSFFLCPAPLPPRPSRAAFLNFPRGRGQGTNYFAIFALGKQMPKIINPSTFTKPDYEKNR